MTTRFEEGAEIIGIKLKLAVTTMCTRVHVFRHVPALACHTPQIYSRLNYYMPFRLRNSHTDFWWQSELEWTLAFPTQNTVRFSVCTCRDKPSCTCDYSLQPTSPVVVAWWLLCQYLEMQVDIGTVVIVTAID